MSDRHPYEEFNDALDQAIEAWSEALQPLTRALYWLADKLRGIGP